MKKFKIIVDTSVLLDFFIDREPLSGHAKKIFLLCHEQKVDGIVNVQSLADLFHALENDFALSERERILGLLLKIFFVANSESKKACTELSEIFPDGLPEHIEEKYVPGNEADYLVESSMENFFYDDVPVLTSAEFLNIYERAKATARISQRREEKNLSATADSCWQLRFRASAYDDNRNLH